MKGAYQILNDEGIHYSLRINENNGRLTCYTQELGTGVSALLDYGYITNDGQLMRWYGNVTSSDDVKSTHLKIWPVMLKTQILHGEILRCFVV